MSTYTKLETDIFNAGSPEMYINLKAANIPPPKHPDRIALITSERKKCQEGITINGVPIPGSLYYTLNFHTIQLDEQNKVTKKINRPIMRPLLRDNDWILHKEYNEAQLEQKAYLLGGSRQLGKSELIVSLTCRELFCYQGAEVMGLFSMSADKETFSKKLQVALDDKVPAGVNPNLLIVPAIDKDLEKTQIRFGLTQKTNDPIITGRLFTYLTKEGKATEIGAGKALRHGSKVYYSGYEGAIEDVKVGDQIFGQDGKLTTVTGVFPQGVKQLYRITLRDGRTVDCCGEHLWKVWDQGLKGWRTRNTEHLHRTNNGKQIEHRTGNTVKKQRYLLPKNEPVNYPEKDLPIDPYYLGVWLGDGSADNPGDLCGIDQEIKDWVKKYGASLGLPYRENNEEQTFSIGCGATGCKSKLTKAFRQYKLRCNKHLPKDYIYSSYDQRLALLQGLMDTDGTCYASGIIEFSNTNTNLIAGVEQIARSLGINCSTTWSKGSYIDKYGVKIPCKDSAKVRMFTSLPLFRLPRKLANYKPKQARGKNYENLISIVSIEKVDEDFATCIQVDNEDHLFLTNDFIVTHNTLTLFFFDEVGKANFRESFEAVKPALLSEFGYRCSPLLVFTGGNLEKSRDAMNMFLSPDSADVKAFETEGLRTGKFMGGWYRQDFKETKTLAEYLNLTDAPSLEQIPIKVTNFDLANEKLDAEILKKQTDKDPMAALKHRMYYPRTLDEMALSAQESPFKKYREGLKKHQDFLFRNPVGAAYEVFETPDGLIHTTLLDRKPITNFPHKDTDNVDEAPLIIYDLPRYDSSQWLHIGGLDTYHTGVTETSPSLGAFYLMRRHLGDLNDPFQNTMVASYVARPERIDDFLKRIKMVLKLYNATMLHEATNDQVLSFFDRQHEAEQYLAKAWSLQQEISPNSRARNVYGVPATVAYQKAYMARCIDYISEVIGIDEGGNPIMGYTRILDPMLIEEMLQYKERLNVDRLIGFSHMLLYDSNLAKDFQPQVDYSAPIESQESYRKVPYGFSDRSGMGSKKIHKPYGFR